MKRQSRRNGGFTLIEVLVVIAIIAILASIVLISLNSARNKASDSRVLSSIRQIRTQLETDYLDAYADITGGPNNVGTISATGPGATNIAQLVADIGAQNGNATLTSIGGTNVDIATDGITVQNGPTPGFPDTGVVIFTTRTSGLADDYAIYATTTAGYICIDSSGNVVGKPGTGTITDPLISSVPLDANNKVVCK